MGIVTPVAVVFSVWSWVVGGRVAEKLSYLLLTAKIVIFIAYGTFVFTSCWFLNVVLWRMFDSVLAF